MKNALFITILFFLLLAGCRREQSLPAVARVGEYTITAAEFRDRANYSPLPASASLEQYKQNVLQALIAEKMISQYNPKPASLADRFAARREKEAVIETFWKKEIESHIKTDDEQLWQLYLKKNRQRDVEVLSAANETEAQMLTRAWIENPQSVRHRLQRDTLQYSGELPVLEDTLFSAPMGKRIGPLKFGRRYITFRVRQEWPLYIVSRGDFLQKRKSLLKSWRRLQKEKLFARYIKEHFPRQPYRLDKEVFRRMTSFLVKELFSAGEKRVQEKMTAMLESRRELMGETVISFDNGQAWTVALLLRELLTGPYPLSYKSEGAFKFSLIKTVRRLLDDELIYRQAVSKGYERAPYVLWQKAMWQSAYRAQKNKKLLSGNMKKNRAVLDSLEKEIPIKIYHNVLDTLRINPTRMMVLKKHFPGQTIVPPLFTVGNP